MWPRLSKHSGMHGLIRSFVLHSSRYLANSGLCGAVPMPHQPDDGALPACNASVLPPTSSPATQFFGLGTCGATGPYGPTLAACQSAYQGTDWLLSFSFGMPVGGSVNVWQSLDFPSGGTFNITVAGAAGSAAHFLDRCRGAVISTVVSLPPNTTLDIIVGQMGLWDGQTGGGGGGTYVLLRNGTALVVAGGGGGTYYGNPPAFYGGCDGSLTSTSGIAAAQGDPGGSNGHASANLTSTSCYGGAGLLDSYSGFGGGTSPLFGGEGGGWVSGIPTQSQWHDGSQYWLQSGGFGGGGFSGGGGGYSGGGGFSNCFGCSFSMGGGGSYCVGSCVANSYNIYDGYVEIEVTLTSPPPAPLNASPVLGISSLFAY